MINFSQNIYIYILNKAVTHDLLKIIF